MRALIFLLCCLAISPRLMAAEIASEVFATASPGVFSLGVIANDGSARIGSGVLVAPGKIATNFHVIADARTIYIKQADNSVEGKLEIADPQHDIALLSAPSITGTPLNLNPNPPKVGQNVYAIGSPRGLELSLSAGIVSSLRPVPGGALIQTTAAISPGSSGGGLFDTQGRLIGLTTAQVQDGQNLNFAIPVAWLQFLGIALPASVAEPRQETLPMPAATPPVIMAAPAPAPAPAPQPAAEMKPPPAPVAAPKAATGFGGLIPATLSIVAIFLLIKPATRWLMNWMESDPVPAAARKKISPPAAPDRLPPFLAQAQQELQDETPDPGSWAQALQQTGQDAQRARTVYPRLRAQALHKADLDRRWNEAAGQHASAAPKRST